LRSLAGTLLTGIGFELAADAGEGKALFRLVLEDIPRRIRTPERAVDESRLDEVKSVEEAEDLLVGPVFGRGDGAQYLVSSPLHRWEGLGGGVGDSDIAIRNEGFGEQSNSVTSLFIVKDVVEDGYQHQSERPVKVEQVAYLGMVQDRPRFTQVCTDGGGGGDILEDGAAVGHRDGIDVDVDDPALRVVRLDEFVDVAGGGDPRADIEKLVDTLFEQEIDCPAQECSIGQGGQPDVRAEFEDLFNGNAIAFEIVIASKKTVIDPGRAGSVQGYVVGNPFG
jgi:hypothetical protein